MTDFPGSPPLPFIISTYSKYTTGMLQLYSQANLAGPVSITWPVANTAFYVPIFLPWPYPVKRVFWCNGSSVSSANADFGIYTSGGTRIYSVGSTAESGTSAPQYTTPSPDFILGPGAYYFAVSCSSASANKQMGVASGAITIGDLRLHGVLQEASALPLPATMTPAAVTNICWPCCGITRTASGF